MRENYFENCVNGIELQDMFGNTMASLGIKPMLTNSVVTFQLDQKERIIGVRMAPNNEMFFFGC
jgi:hypothetical protein